MKPSHKSLDSSKKHECAAPHCMSKGTRKRTGQKEAFRRFSAKYEEIDHDLENASLAIVLAHGLGVDTCEPITDILDGIRMSLCLLNTVLFHEAPSSHDPEQLIYMLSRRIEAVIELRRRELLNDDNATLISGAASQGAP